MRKFTKRRRTKVSRVEKKRVENEKRRRRGERPRVISFTDIFLDAVSTIPYGDLEWYFDEHGGVVTFERMRRAALASTRITHQALMLAVLFISTHTTPRGTACKHRVLSLFGSLRHDDLSFLRDLGISAKDEA